MFHFCACYDCELFKHLPLAPTCMNLCSPHIFFPQSALWFPLSYTLGWSIQMYCLIPVACVAFCKKIWDSFSIKSILFWLTCFYFCLPFGLFIVNILFYGKVLNVYWRRGIRGEVPSQFILFLLPLLIKIWKKKKCWENKRNGDTIIAVCAKLQCACSSSWNLDLCFRFSFPSTDLIS